MAETPSTERRVPKIIIPLKVWKTLTNMVEQNTLEWMMFGKTRRDGADFILEDLYVPKQRNTGASTEVEGDGLVEMMEELDDKGEDLSAWNVWIHSHNTMGCFWSGTDYAQMNAFDGDGPDFMLNIVLSSKDGKNGLCNTKASLALYKPVKVIIDDLQVVLQQPEKEDDPWAAALQEVLEARQTKVTYSAPYGGNTYGKTHGMHSYYDDDNDFYSNRGLPAPKNWGVDPRDTEEKEELQEEVDALEVELDDIFISTMEDAGLSHTDRNIEIVEEVKTVAGRYWHLFRVDEVAVDILAQHYKGTAKEFKKRLKKRFEGDSRLGVLMTRMGNAYIKLMSKVGDSDSDKESSIIENWKKEISKNS